MRLSADLRRASTPEQDNENGRLLSFPKDHGAHTQPAEWWYVNGRLAADGSDQAIWFAVAFFKLRLGWPGWLSQLRSTSDFLFGYQVHGSVYDEATGEFRSETKSSVYLPYRVQFRREDLAIKMRGNVFERTATDGFRLRSAFSCLSLDLLMSSSSPPMIHGTEGLIPMGSKGESMYYSFSSLDAEGLMSCAGKTARVRGCTWFDHQWGKWQDNCVYWKWFCVQLTNQSQIMIYIFENGGEAEPKVAITLQEASGECFHSGQLANRLHDHYVRAASGISYPTSHEFRFEINHRRYWLSFTALHNQQEIRSAYVDYWEGPCEVTGTVDETPLAGAGFSEIVGRYVYGDAIPKV